MRMCINPEGERERELNGHQSAMRLKNGTVYLLSLPDDLRNIGKWGRNEIGMKLTNL